jgi:6-phosphogluconolactonase
MLFVANKASNNISAYAINQASGALTAMSGSPFASGTSPASLAVDPNGQLVLTANEGSNNVSVYTINGGNFGPVLNPVPGSPFATGTGPVALTVEPSSHFVYVVNKGSNNVSAFKIGTNGAFTAVTGSPFATGTNPHAVVADPLGRFVYVAGGGAAAPGTVTAYRINSVSGALTALTGSPFAAGLNPTSLAVDVTGQFLYVTNSGDGTISRFTIDPSTGALSAETTVPAGASPASIATTGKIQ